MKSFYPRNLWHVTINGINVILKATQDEIERLYQTNDGVSDYAMVVAYKPKKGGVI